MKNTTILQNQGFEPKFIYLKKTFKLPNKSENLQKKIIKCFQNLQKQKITTLQFVKPKNLYNNFSLDFTKAL